MCRRDSGFSLLEILVAFVILALTLGVIMRLFSSGTRQIGLADRHAGAVVMAESVLAGLGTEMPLVVGELSGGDGQVYRWHVRISDYISSDEGTGVVSPLRLLLIDLDVDWGETGKKGDGLRYTTLRVAQPQ